MLLGKLSFHVDSFLWICSSIAVVQSIYKKIDYLREYGSGKISTTQNLGHFGFKFAHSFCVSNPAMRSHEEKAKLKAVKIASCILSLHRGFPLFARGVGYDQRSGGQRIPGRTTRCGPSKFSRRSDHIAVKVSRLRAALRL